MKCKVIVELVVEGDFEFPDEARDLIETELSFPEEIWDNVIKDIDYVRVEEVKDDALSQQTAVKKE